MPQLVSATGGFLVGELPRRKLREKTLQTGALVVADHLLGLLLRACRRNSDGRFCSSFAARRTSARSHFVVLNVSTVFAAMQALLRVPPRNARRGQTASARKGLRLSLPGILVRGHVR